MTRTPPDEPLDARLARALRHDRRLRWVVVGIASLAMVLSGTGLLVVAKRSSDTAGDVARVEPRVTQNEDKAEVARKKAASTTKTATAARRSSKRVVRFLQGKQGIPGVPGRNGKIGAPGPQGPAGRAGRAGRPPTQAEIADAVAAFCSGDACRGRGLTRDDVLSAVALYCASRDCRGPRGFSGTDGKDGAPGRDGAPSPGTFTAQFPDFNIDCTDVGPDGRGGRAYACTSPPPPPTP